MAGDLWGSLLGSVPWQGGEGSQRDRGRSWAANLREASADPTGRTEEQPFVSKSNAPASLVGSNFKNDL